MAIPGINGKEPKVSSPEDVSSPSKSSHQASPQNKRSSIQAVVLAAGSGSRMPEVANSVPKCLLPVGTIPLLWYPLDLLARSGFKEATVVVREGLCSRVKAALAEKVSLTLHFATIPDDKDFGTADSLRYLGLKGELLIISGDLITTPETMLAPLITTHLQKDAALTVLLASYPSSKPPEVPGFKQKPIKENDLIGINIGTSQLVLLQPLGDGNSFIDVNMSTLRNSPNRLTRTLLDTHVYLLSEMVVEFVHKSQKISSLKADLLPHLIRRQFKNSAQEDGLNPLEWQNNEDPWVARMQRFLPSPSQQNTNGETPRCFALEAKAPALRVNTLLSYMWANSLVISHFSSAHPPAGFSLKAWAGSLLGSKTQRGKKCVIQKSVVGHGVKIGAKSRVDSCVLMDGAIVEDGATLVSTLILPEVIVGGGSQLRACIAAQNVPANSNLKNEVVDASVEVFGNEESGDEEV